MKIGEAFPSKYIKAADLQGRPVKAVIDSVEITNIGDDEDKLVIYFRGKKKGLVCNVTNARMIEEIMGSDETDEWAGREILLYPTKVDYAGRRVDAIRVDYPDAQRSPQQPQRSTAPVQPPLTILPQTTPKPPVAPIQPADWTDGVPPPTDDDIPF